MKKYTLDRFEGEIAVLLPAGKEAERKTVSRSQLPDGVQEGDVLEVEWGDDCSLKNAVIDKEETEKRKGRAKALLEKLTRKRKK
ncbi:DUF3006 domain-containing protein [Alteribacillus sp. HJP-4]|uniref:DUF3006 domain-containing protein n=1 Tax=Alteribacillus sp. HJP-4 TaxID=2775394 RepID=UPI0035CCEE46